jgi:hypothetical protein
MSSLSTIHLLLTQTHSQFTTLQGGVDDGGGPQAAARRLLGVFPPLVEDAMVVLLQVRGVGRAKGEVRDQADGR